MVVEEPPSGRDPVKVRSLVSDRTRPFRKDEIVECKFCEKDHEDPDHLPIDCRQRKQFGLSRDGSAIEDFKRSTRTITRMLFSRVVTGTESYFWLVLKQRQLTLLNFIHLNDDLTSVWKQFK